MAVSLDADSKCNCLETGVVGSETEGDEDDWLFRSVKRWKICLIVNTANLSDTNQRCADADILASRLLKYRPRLRPQVSNDRRLRVSNE